MKMDSVYGTKKYFPSLSNVNNVYRGQSCRSLANEFSYSNTMGRHSPLGPYFHMGKPTTYSTDMSVNSQYGYNTWGTINDVRNIAPRLYTSKRPHKFRSFSIILTTAGLIVLLAVLSIGALAFYFSGFKPNTEESMMVFEGAFRIQKGDSYSKALKNNQSSIFRQKVDFYRRFVERSLSDNDLQLTKVDIQGFGDGPLIDVQFVILLDMQSVPQNIHSIEDHIRNSLFLETNSLKSLYKFLKIEPESVRIVRVTGDSMNKIAPTLRHQDPASKQSHFEKKLTKNLPKLIDRTPSKHIPATYQPKSPKRDNNAEIDIEHAPVVQGSFEGSFEITKTDADITAKKTSPAKPFSPYPKLTTTTMSVQSKNMKNKPEEGTTTTLIKTALITPTPTTTLTVETTTVTPASTNILLTTELGKIETNTKNEFIISTLPASVNTQPTLQVPTTSEGPMNRDTSFPPRLDLNLFTSAPVLDTKPWHPIHPSSSLYNNMQEYEANDGPNYSTVGSSPVDRIDSELIARSKIFPPASTEPPSRPIFYQSFTNTVFMPGTTEIEKLGSSDVKPYPIPVPLIDEVVAPDLKSILPMHKISNEFASSLNITQATTEIGTEVVKEKQSNYEPIKKIDGTQPQTTAPISMQVTDTDLHGDIGEVLLELLQTSQNTSKILHSEELFNESSTEKPNFLNIKEIVLNKTKFSSKPVNKSIVEDRVMIKSPTILNDTQLYPTQTKWEYKHDLTNQAQMRNSLKKKYNETLQAVIIENHETLNTSLAQGALKRNSSEDIENITLIFDTLASKLGITSSFPSKEPPFAVSSQQKLKHDQHLLGDAKKTATPSMPNASPSSISSTSSVFSTEQEAIIGEAEVEVVDPTKYEEMLSSQSVSSTTNHSPTLVTLMPVRSNSGIRKLNPLEASTAEGRKFGSEPFVYREAIVRSGIQVQA